MDGEISADELEQALETDDETPLIVDIRSPSEFERERIVDSINVPLSKLPQQIDRVADASHVVTVCPHGKASVRAGKLINSFEEFYGRVESLECGLSGWDGPVESDNETVDASHETPF